MTEDFTLRKYSLNNLNLGGNYDAARRLLSDIDAI